MRTPTLCIGQVDMKQDVALCSEVLNFYRCLDCSVALCVGYCTSGSALQHTDAEVRFLFFI